MGYKLLAPGGYLILDEKDVLRPVRFKLPSIIDSGRAHIYHFTRCTLARFLEQSGFEVLQCEIDRHRKSTFRHIRTVARKPHATEISATGPNFSAPTAGEIFRKVWWSEQRWKLTRARRFAKRGFRRSAA